MSYSKKQCRPRHVYHIITYHVFQDPEKTRIKLRLNCEVTEIEVICINQLFKCLMKNTTSYYYNFFWLLIS